MIRALVRDLDRAHFTMPPWSGTPEEAELVAAYLAEHRPAAPDGMLPRRNAEPETTSDGTARRRSDDPRR